MNLQVQAYKGETQRCSRLDNKQHIRWWKKSKILIALSGWGSAQDRSCRGSQPVGVFWGFFTFPTARRQKESAIKPKVNFLVFNVNSVQPGLEDVRHPNSTWIMNQQGGESICLRKVFKRTPVRTGFHEYLMTQSLSARVQHSNKNVPNGVNSSSADVNVRCL